MCADREAHLPEERVAGQRVKGACLAPTYSYFFLASRQVVTDTTRLGFPVHHFVDESSAPMQELAANGAEALFEIVQPVWCQYP